MADVIGVGTPNVWYTSKTLWTLILMVAFDFAKVAGIVNPDTNTMALVNAALSTLAGYFRTSAKGPLTLT